MGVGEDIVVVWINESEFENYLKVRGEGDQYHFSEVEGEKNKTYYMHPWKGEKRTGSNNHGDCCKYVSRPYPHDSKGKCLGDTDGDGNCAWHPSGCPRIDVFAPRTVELQDQTMMSSPGGAKQLVANPRDLEELQEHKKLVPLHAVGSVVKHAHTLQTNAGPEEHNGTLEDCQHPVCEIVWSANKSSREAKEHQAVTQAIAWYEDDYKPLKWAQATAHSQEKYLRRAREEASRRTVYMEEEKDGRVNPE